MNDWNARSRGCERQAPARHEIEDFRIAPGFQHDSAKRFAGKRVFRGAERAHWRQGMQHNQPAWIKSKFKKAGRRKLAAERGGKILPHPQKIFFSRKAQGEHERKTSSRCRMPLGGKNLVQYPRKQPVMQRPVGIGVAERNTARKKRPGFQPSQFFSKFFQ